MGKKIVIQRKGQTMKEGTIGRWLKKDGDNVRAGEALYELEYDKAACEVEAPADGILHIWKEEGSTLPVGTTIAEILKEGEVSVREADAKMETKEEEKASLDGTRIRATPYARKIARLNRVDLKEVRPKKGSRIVAADVQRYLDSRVSESMTDAAEPEAEKRVPMSAMRRAIAKNMTQSYFGIPAVTFSMEVDFSGCLEFRKELNEEYAKEGIKVSINDLILKGVAAALKKYPDMNVSMEGDDIIYHSGIHVGMAVAVPGGLVVPVVRNAHKKSPDEMAKITKALIEKAMNGTLTGEEMSGGTFTVTNLGSRGVDMFTPIINGNQAAILGVGRVQEKPVVVDGAVEIRPMAVLSLTVDHRLIDGAAAADFLGVLKHILEKPIFMFI